ncbi:MAG: zinc-ribbon domain-containing protein [Promethearchaeota archaeon]
MNFKKVGGKMMFCQNCGEKLEMENQRFCQNCGSEIINISTPPTTTFGMDQEVKPTKPIPVPQYPSKFTLAGKVGPYSKRALGFGIVSLIIGVISFNVGTTFIGYPYPFYFARIFIGLAIVHVVGIIFGIVSRVSSGKAKALEPESSILKAGIALGIIGLIINSILLIADIVFM